MPVEILRKAQIDLNDKLFFEVDENKRIILTKTPTPKAYALLDTNIIIHYSRIATSFLPSLCRQFLKKSAKRAMELSVSLFYY